MAAAIVGVIIMAEGLREGGEMGSIPAFIHILALSYSYGNSRKTCHISRLIRWILFFVSTSPLCKEILD